MFPNSVNAAAFEAVNDKAGVVVLVATDVVNNGLKLPELKDVTPPPVAPVAPGGTYGRMVQAESGGQNYTPQGTPVTSPAGAMFATQVMPATAQQPGFGIQPAQSQTPEEYNRVGQEYYQALLKKYNGDEQRAAAAYNMGPGAVDRNIAQNQGQFNVGQAPKETQGYLGRVLNAVVPSAQAAPVAPQAPAVPGTQVTPGRYVDLANSQGPRVGYQQPGPVAYGHALCGHAAHLRWVLHR